jgi:hypothetical protein
MEWNVDDLHRGIVAFVCRTGNGHAALQATPPDRNPLSGLSPAARKQQRIRRLSRTAVPSTDQRSRNAVRQDKHYKDVMLL